MIPKNRPPPPPTRISIPAEVASDTDAKAEWIRITAALKEALDERDRSLLADYCITHSEIIDLRASVAIEGRTCTGDKGGTYINPTCNLLISRQSHLAALRRDLYFTPKSRIEKQPKSTIKGQSIKERIQQDAKHGDDDQD